MDSGKPPRFQLNLVHKGFIIIWVPLFFQIFLLIMIYLVGEQLKEQNARLEREHKAMTCTTVLIKEFFQAGTSLAAYGISKNPTYGERYDHAVEKIVPTLDEFEQLVAHNPVQLDAAKKIRSTTERGLKSLDELKQTTEEGGRIGSLMSTHKAFKTLREMLTELEEGLDKFGTEMANTTDNDAVSRLRGSFNTLTAIVSAGSIVVIALAYAMGHIYYTSIAHRLRRVMDNTYRLARSEKLNPPLKGTDEIAHLDGVFHDMASALADAARKERAVIENALDVICSLDADGRFTAVSPASVEVWGFAPEELIGKKHTEMIVVEDIVPTLEAVHSIISNGAAEPFENRVIRKDGTLVYILWSAYWSPIEQSMFCVAHDITERKQAENLLRDSESRVRSIIEGMPVGLMVINERGVIELINPQTERMFGYKFEDLVGKHVSLLLPKSTEFAETTFEESLIAKLVGRVKEVEGLRLDGDVFPVELTFENYITAEGERFLVNMLDVSERHEVERLKREFVSTVSHELRTPLTAIRGSLGLLALGALGDLTEKAHKVVKIAERNSIRLINLINDLLDIEKLEAGKLELAVDETALAPIVERSVESVRAVAEQYGIRIEVQNLDATVFADGDRLVQVLVNLLSNGIKYSPREDVILLTVEDEPEQVRVRVTDHGRGIPPDLKEKIFERFQQVEVADAKQKGGTGLGLAICKAIVEQHKGEIGVESEEGKGSTFWFSIPKAGSPRALEWARERGMSSVIQIAVKNDVAAGQKSGEGQVLLLADTNKVAEERG